MNGWGLFFETAEEAVNYTIRSRGNFAFLYDLPTLEYWKGINISMSNARARARAHTHTHTHICTLRAYVAHHVYIVQFYLL